MLRLLIEIEESVDDLVGKAITSGFKRVEPRRRWSEAEKKDAIRYYIQYLIRKDKSA